MRYPTEFDAAAFPETPDLFLRLRLRYRELSETLVCVENGGGILPRMQMHYPEFPANTRGCLPDGFYELTDALKEAVTAQNIGSLVVYLQSGLNPSTRQLMEAGLRASLALLMLREFEVQELPESPQKGMSVGRAALLALGDSFVQGLLCDRLTYLDMRILTWLLSMSGENLNLRFREADPVPFASNFHRVLESMSEQYQIVLTGTADDAEILLCPGGLICARERLRIAPETADRVGRITDLISGYETTEGLLRIVGFLRGRNVGDARCAEDVQHRLVKSDILK